MSNTMNNYIDHYEERATFWETRAREGHLASDAEHAPDMAAHYRELAANTVRLNWAVELATAAANETDFAKARVLWNRAIAMINGFRELPVPATVFDQALGGALGTMFARVAGAL